MAFTKAQLDAYIQGLYDDDGQLDAADNQLIINFILSNGNPEIDPRDLIQIRRGDEADLPMLAQGEMGYTLDGRDLYVGGLAGNDKFYNANKIDKILGIDIEKYSKLVIDLDGINEDWTPAFTQAFLDIPIDGAELLFTRPSYKYSQPITIPKNTVARYVRMTGRHAWGTILYYTGTTSPAINAKGGVAGGDRIYFEMRDIGVHYSGISPSINGIELKYNTPSSNFINLFANGFTGSGVLSEDNWNLTFINLRSTNNTLDGFRRNAGSMNNFRFIGGEFNANGRFGMYLNGRNHILDSPSLESNGETQLFMSGCLGLTINSPYLEDQGTGPLLKGIACSGVVINGVDISIFNDGADMFDFNACNVTINGFLCEISGLTTAKTGTAIKFTDCRSFTLNNCDFRNIATGVTISNSYGKINTPEFAYVTTPLSFTDHAFTWVEVSMISDYFATSNIPSTATKFVRRTYINKAYRGTTAERPTAVVLPFEYFDTTLGKPIYWNGTAWIDATGTIV